MYPEIFVNLDAISLNSSEILRICAARGTANAVLKGVCGDPAIALAVMDSCALRPAPRRLKTRGTGC